MNKSQPEDITKAWETTFTFTFIFTFMHWRRKWHPTPVFLPGKSHGQRNPVGYNPWGHK